MKKHTILTKTFAIISCAMLLYATFPQQARAGDCAQDQGLTPAVAAVSCACSDGLTGSCGGPQITPFAGYHTCLPLGDSGYASCKDDPQVEFYDSTPCIASYSFWGMAGCAAAIIIAGGVDLGVCFTAGVWTGGAACYSAIVGTAGLATIVACHYCAIHNCNASDTGVTRVMKTPSEPDSNSGTCAG